MALTSLEKKVSDLVLGERVHTVNKDATLEEATGKLREANIGSLIITEGKKPVGIFTERDFLRKTAGIMAGSQPITEFMTPDPKCVQENVSIKKVVIMMRMGRFRHLVVTDNDGNLQNVISIKDVLDFIVDEAN